MQDFWFRKSITPPNDIHFKDAGDRQAQLTKPAGSLGALERIACRLAAMQEREKPSVDSVSIRLFAADHGIARKGVSAFPQEVTVQMVANFCQGGAAISVLASEIGADLEVVDMGTCSSPLSIPGVIDRTVSAGTLSFDQHRAMTEPQLLQALAAGAEQVDSIGKAGCELFIAGEMGIGNTSSATAISASLLDRTPADLVGPGTGIDAEHLARKTEIIETALAFHRAQGADLKDAFEVLQCVGGFEIAAMAGAYMRCAQLGVPILVDGFISTAAFLCAERLAPGTAHWAFAGHVSAEPGHRVVLEALELEPLLQLQMRLGEGSGAAVATPLIRNACALHNNMATFAEAAVSNAG
ncbi:nicotinate-nucleotide--dimethylbenzimidazole phosphoribosyltransferase [Aestuariirhabdus sp. LZHN29]|uniref:nicotinate-nucleotide--dimethylbenzimidazole phosphoribosyltransferase n=1 Tax=Aestuariirhabdus sp. LZHN29 TaxID=3417462 RepID=UPI003CFAF9B5